MIDMGVASTTQTWFRKRGLTMLLGGTPLAKRTSERAAPALVACFLLAMMFASVMTSFELLPAMLIGLGVVLATWVASNLMRGRRPLAAVSAIGWLEAAAFVIVPAAVVAAASNVTDFGDAETEPWLDKIIFVVIMVLAQIIVLVAVLALERLGVLTLASWLARALFGSVSSTGSALATSLPVSLGVVFFFFLNPGVWGSIGMLTPTPYFAVMGLLLLLAAAFLGSQRHLDIASLTSFETASEFSEALDATPLAGSAEVNGPVECPLSRGQRFYIRQVAVLSQLVVGLIIAAAVFALFLVIGYLAVDPGTTAAWTRGNPAALLHYTGPTHAYVLTEAHLRVAGFLAAFVAFNYSLASATDARLRHGSKEAATEAIRQASAMRIALLSPRDAHDA